MTNWLLLVGVVVVAIAGAELGLRWRATVRCQRVLQEQGLNPATMSAISSDRPGLYWSMRPLRNGANSRGYFDDEHALEKPVGTFRIVVIGDSVVAGHGVAREDSFPRRLEAQVRELAPTHAWEVVALACSGYSTAQELILLRDEAFTYRPDLIVWSYMLNDPAHPLFENGGWVWEIYRPSSQLGLLLARARWKLYVTSHEQSAPAEWHARLHHLYREQIAANLARIGDLCREHQVPAVLIINPVFKDEPSFDSYPLLAVHRQVHGAAAAAGLNVLDLLEAYRDRDPRTLALPNDPWHPNPDGHRLIATFLARALSERRLLPAISGAD